MISIPGLGSSINSINLCTNTFRPYYTQFLVCNRLEKNPVVYIFDEVGCGKTVSAIIGMAYTIKANNCNGKPAKILVSTPLSVCYQFSKEIEEKLPECYNLCKPNKNISNNFYSVDVINVFKDTKKKWKSAHLSELINNHDGNLIAITNPNRIDLFSGIKDDRIEWDLIIIDEAHDTICNNQKQIDYRIFKKAREAYDYYSSINDPKMSELIKDLNSQLQQDKDSLKSLNASKSFIDDYDTFTKLTELNTSICHKRDALNYCHEIPTNRYSDTNTFYEFCWLNSTKLMFLSATPYKSYRNFDFYNYGFVASMILNNPDIPKLLPDLTWLDSIYGNDHFTLEDLQKMEYSNTSLIFKEIATSIPYTIDASSSASSNAKDRKVEIWDETNSTNPINLQAKILELMENKSNRLLIFVSNSREGEYIFKKIFSNEQNSILSESNGHRITINNIVCEFIMNKFNNTYKLKDYATENEKIPNILILTWQSAQVGINLPTFNYVINYHISSIPGYLEQRYGRIDRLNTEYNDLHNIYYFDRDPRASIYRYNFLVAMEQYINNITNTASNIPVKNLLLYKGMELPSFEITNSFLEQVFMHVGGYIKELTDKQNTSGNNPTLNLNNEIQAIFPPITDGTNQIIYFKLCKTNNSTLLSLIVNSVNRTVLLPSGQANQNLSREISDLLRDPNLPVFDESYNSNLLEPENLSDVIKQYHTILKNFIQQSNISSNLNSALKNNSITETNAVIFRHNGNQIKSNCTDIANRIIQLRRSSPQKI